MKLRYRLKAMWLLLRGWGVCVGCDFIAPLKIDVRENKKQHICNNTIWGKEE